MTLDKLKINPNNPRFIRDNNYKKLKQSLKDFPQMLELRPIVYDENDTVLGGNMRLRALKELSKEGLEIKDSWFKKASELTEDQKKEFIIKDNVPFGEWDTDILANEWSDLPLEEWGVDTRSWEEKDNNVNYESEYEVVIQCENEDEQREVYEDLTSKGYKCKVLSL